jgi:hypothetical protein
MIIIRQKGGVTVDGIVIEVFPLQAAGSKIRKKI